MRKTKKVVAIDHDPSCSHNGTNCKTCRQGECSQCWSGCKRGEALRANTHIIVAALRPESADIPNQVPM